MVLTWSRKIHSIEIGLRPSKFSVENFIALAGLEVKLGKIWSQHGPGMVQKNRYYIEMGLRPFTFSVENFSALAGLEVKFAQTWSQQGPDKIPNNTLHRDGP